MTTLDHQRKHIAIVGAGVIGLTIAQEARRRNYKVSIFARDFPPGALDDDHGDAQDDSPVASQDWSSPWAGFNWCSFATPQDTMTQRRDEATFKRWMDMVRHRVLPREHMDLMPFLDIRSDPIQDHAEQAWFKHLVPEVR